VSPGPGRQVVRGQDGGLSVELVVLAPVLVLLCIVVVALGRAEIVHADVADAARAAAEAAVEAPVPTDAADAARTAAVVAFPASGPSCRPLHVTTTAGDFVSGGRVTVEVRCAVSLASLAVPGLPGTVTFEATVAAVVDPYRSIG
jgi:Flp pilus assembly protein TadG